MTVLYTEVLLTSLTTAKDLNILSDYLLWVCKTKESVNMSKMSSSLPKDEPSTRCKGITKAKRKHLQKSLSFTCSEPLQEPSLLLPVHHRWQVWLSLKNSQQVCLLILYQFLNPWCLYNSCLQILAPVTVLRSHFIMASDTKLPRLPILFS